MTSSKMDEETQGLLRKILRAQAYRQIMAANIRGHGLKFLLDSEGRIGLVADIQHILQQVRRVQELYTSIGGGDIRREASVKMERIPYPETRFELAAFLATSDLAEKTALESYLNSSCTALASIARNDLDYERTATIRSHALFQEFAGDPAQKPLVRQVLNRWLTICLLSLGRPGTAGDRRACELGLRSLSCADSIRLYIERLAPILEISDVDLSELADAGVELPS
ncbi:MAG: hypothetical protein ACI8X5_003391 [Planctomycetota bacterium]|jgi:hypothetical protein